MPVGWGAGGVADGGGEAVVADGDGITVGWHPPRHDDGQRRCAAETIHGVALRIVEAWERDDLECR
jgi:hypothetical protein